VVETSGEQGRTDDPHSPVHAGVRGFGGLSAACGAGRLVQLVPGRFDTDGRDVCPDCADAVREE
jgi:hypothetical protein